MLVAKTKQIIMEKLTKEAVVKEIESIKSLSRLSRAMNERRDNEPECYLYTDFVESIANGLYSNLEEVVEVAKVLLSVKL